MFEAIFAIDIVNHADCINSTELRKLWMGLEKILSGELNFVQFLRSDCF